MMVKDEVPLGVKLRREQKMLEFVYVNKDFEECQLVWT